MRSASLFVIAVFVFAASFGNAQIHNLTQDTPHADFESAIDNAVAGDVLEVRDDITLPTGVGWGMGIDKAITIQGDGNARTITMGEAYSAEAGILALLTGTAVLKDLTIDGGGYNIAAIRTLGGNLTLENVTIENAYVGFQSAAAGGDHVIDGSTVSASLGGVSFIGDGGTTITLQNGSAVVNCTVGVNIAPALENCAVVVDGSSITGSGLFGIRVEGVDSLVRLQNGAVVENSGSGGIGVEDSASGTDIEISDTLLINNGSWHLIVANGGGAEGDLTVTRTTFWGGASGSNPISVFDEMTADISYSILANWAAGGNEGINSCCGFNGTISFSVMVNDDLIPANVDPLVPDTVLTTTVHPLITTYDEGNVYSVFYNTDSSSEDFLTLNADPKDGDARIAAAHLIDGENNAGARPVGGFVGTTSVQDWLQF